MSNNVLNLAGNIEFFIVSLVAVWLMYQIMLIKKDK